MKIRLTPTPPLSEEGSLFFDKVKPPRLKGEGVGGEVKLTLLLLLLSTLTFAQKAKITGKVVDNQTDKGLGYASIRLYKVPDSAFVTGGISADDGTFSIEANQGNYYALVEFIGYQPLKTAVFEAKGRYDLGIIKIKSSARKLDEVVVQGEKSTMTMELDKRVFMVGKDLANAGGTASDILGNIPSVSVDTEGNVKLRGSDNVRILIDGKPSGLVSFKGGAGLQQLQGSMVERVEVITNPSAKYEAEGLSGIINIVLKKDQKQGLNGSFEVITGYRPNYGLAVNMNYRKNKINFFLNYGFAYRVPFMAGKLYQEVYANKDTTKILSQTSQSNVATKANNIRGGLDYFFNDKNILTASYSFRRTDVHRITDIVYNDFLNSLNKQLTTTNRQQDETEAEPYSDYVLTYKKTYARKGHELVADVRYLTYWERSNQTFTQNSFFMDNRPNTKDTKLQKSINDEYENQLQMQLDYVQPMGKDGKFEAGWRSSIRDMVNDYYVNEQNAAGVFVPMPGLKNYFTYQENIHGAYGILGNKTAKMSYQAGLRMEMTDINTELRDTKQTNFRRYSNLFPSAHLSYNFKKDNALQVSYSRRVRRPTYNDLSPFVTFSDQRNFNAGNPDLNPEFTNSFDLGIIRYLQNGTITSSVYYRHTTDKVLRIRRVDSRGFSTTRPENLAFEDAFGAEFTSTYNLQKWWKFDFNFNFFRAITDGSNLDKTYKSDTYSWFARQTSRFTLIKGADLQVRGNYEAPQKLPQGSRKARAFMDVAFSKDILAGKGTLTVNAIDVFNSRYMTTITEGANFYTDAIFGMKARQINITLNYRLNRAKGTAKRNFGGEEGN